MGCSRCSSFTGNRPAASNAAYDSYGPKSGTGFRQATNPAGLLFWQDRAAWGLTPPISDSSQASTSLQSTTSEGQSFQNLGAAPHVDQNSSFQNLGAAPSVDPNSSFQNLGAVRPQYARSTYNAFHVDWVLSILGLTCAQFLNKPLDERRSLVDWALGNPPQSQAYLVDGTLSQMNQQCANQTFGSLFSGLFSHPAAGAAPAGAMALPSQFSSNPWGPALLPAMPLGPSVRFVTGPIALQMMGHSPEDWVALTQDMRILLLSRLNNKSYYVGPFPGVPNLEMQAGILNNLYYQLRRF